MLYTDFYGQSFSAPPVPVVQTDESSDSTPAVQPSNTSNTTPQKPRTAGVPVAISVPDANINIGVAPGYYNPQTKKWTLGPDSAYFVMASARPNAQGGNTYIYGHNRSSVFSRLPKVHPGSLVTVKTDSGATYTYRFNYRRDVNPNDSAAMAFDGAPRLTLQTCTGLFYQNRSLFVFDLVGESHA